MIPGTAVAARCVGVKRVTPQFSTKFACGKCEWNTGKAFEHRENLCDEVEENLHILVTG